MNICQHISKFENIEQRCILKCCENSKYCLDHKIFYDMKKIKLPEELGYRGIDRLVDLSKNYQKSNYTSKNHNH